MRIRQLIREPKLIASDTQWRSDDMPPRHSGIYPKSLPTRPGKRWRSVVVTSATNGYIFLTQCDARKDNWKAWLILKGSDGSASLVSRLEYHGNHPGLHAHAHCDRGGLEFGPSSIDKLARCPSAKSDHRTVLTFREASFWERARKHFRIEYPKGPLL